jgi:hypothetical protein
MLVKQGDSTFVTCSLLGQQYLKGNVCSLHFFIVLLRCFSLPRISYAWNGVEAGIESQALASWWRVAPVPAERQLVVACGTVAVVPTAVGRAAHGGGRSFVVLLTPSFISVVGGRAHPALGGWPSLVEPVSHGWCWWWLLHRGRLT